MAYYTDGLLYYDAWTRVRSNEAVIAADSATLTDANIPTASALTCTGFETVLVRVAITAGSSPSMTLEALFRDANAEDGSRWTRRWNSSGSPITTSALTPGNEQEIYVDGWPSVFLRISAVANAGSTTAWAIYARPGKRWRARVQGGR